jgi:sulfur relay (sulfurtransferase) DsrF/TusC family protein
VITSICVIVRRPKGNELSTLGIRTAWATLMGGMDARLVYVEDGVYNLLPHPGYNTAMLQDYVKEGGPVYAAKRHVEERGLNPEDFVEGVELISDEEVAELVADCQSNTLF